MGLLSRDIAAPLGHIALGMKAENLRDGLGDRFRRGKDREDHLGVIP
jgi:hypothetical protein